MTEPQPLIPVLVCEDIAAEHDFLVDAFGFASGGLDRAPDGVATHGEVRVAGAAIWLHRVTAEHGLAAPRALPAQAGGLVIEVPDVDAHHARVAGTRARVDGPPADRPYGRREYGVRDPEGHRWWFGTWLR